MRALYEQSCEIPEENLSHIVFSICFSVLGSTETQAIAVTTWWG